MNTVAEAEKTYLAARTLHAALYHDSADKWHLLPVRTAVGRAFDAMMAAQRALIDAIGKEPGQAYVLALDNVLKAETALQKAQALFTSIKKTMAPQS